MNASALLLFLWYEKARHASEVNAALLGAMYRLKIRSRALSIINYSCLIKNSFLFAQIAAYTCTMNIVFAALILINAVMLLFISPDKILLTVSSASASAVGLTIKMLGIYAVWLGVMALLEKSNISTSLATILKKPCKKLFGEMSEAGYLYTTMNFTANFIGLGNAATPMGIKAVGEIKNNTYQLAMLMVINATGMQLLSTTVLSLMTEYGAMNASSVILPTLLSSTISTICGVLLVMVFFKKPKQERT